MLAAYLFLTFNDEFHIVLQEAVPEQVLECLDMHESLAFVIIGTASPDGPVVYYRLERVAVPLLKGLRRLHIIVDIDQDGLERRVQDLAGEYDRVSLCRADHGLVGTCLP